MGAATVELATLTEPGRQIIPRRFEQTVLTREPTSTVRAYVPKPRRPSARPHRILFGALTDPRLRLKRAIPLEITRKEDAVVVHSRDLEEFGCGVTMSDAVDDFSKGVSELFGRLSEEAPDRLGPDMARLKDKLSRYLEVRARR